MKKFSIFHVPSSIDQKGFTLLELLIVVVIISILSTLLMANYVDFQKRGRDGQRKGDIGQLKSALEFYRADEGAYPDAVKNCPADPTYLGNLACTSTYKNPIPTDPTTAEEYTYEKSGSTYTIVACLENENDQQIDLDGGGDKIPCSDGTERWQYTTANP